MGKDPAFDGGRLMSDGVIRVENISKEYRFGVIGHGTLYGIYKAHRRDFGEEKILMQRIIADLHLRHSAGDVVMIATI